MKWELSNPNQKNIFRPILKEIINPNHELVILSKQIVWGEFENSFNKLYSHTCQPAVPIRTMVGLLLLKGTIGNDINANLAAAGYNLRGLLKKIKKQFFWSFFILFDFSDFKKIIFCCL